jgi:hypothetical protein
MQGLFHFDAMQKHSLHCSAFSSGFHRRVAAVRQVL